MPLQLQSHARHHHCHVSNLTVNGHNFGGFTETGLFTANYSNQTDSVVWAGATAQSGFGLDQDGSTPLVFTDTRMAALSASSRSTWSMVPIGTCRHGPRLVFRLRPPHHFRQPLGCSVAHGGAAVSGCWAVVCKLRQLVPDRDDAVGFVSRFMKRLVLRPSR